MNHGIHFRLNHLMQRNSNKKIKNSDFHVLFIFEIKMQPKSGLTTNPKHAQKKNNNKQIMYAMQTKTKDVIVCSLNNERNKLNK